MTAPEPPSAVSASIDELITRLVQEAPALDDAVTAQLVEQLRADGSPLARSIARVVELVGEQLVDAGIALPALAMACATLRETDATAREAARFEIETLLPLPDGPKMRVVMPDVSVTRLKRRN